MVFIVARERVDQELEILSGGKVFAQAMRDEMVFKMFNSRDRLPLTIEIEPTKMKIEIRFCSKNICHRVRYVGTNINVDINNIIYEALYGPVWVKIRGIKTRIFQVENG